MAPICTYLGRPGLDARRRQDCGCSVQYSQGGIEFIVTPFPSSALPCYLSTWLGRMRAPRPADFTNSMQSVQPVRSRAARIRSIASGTGGEAIGEVLAGAGFECARHEVCPKGAVRLEVARVEELVTGRYVGEFWVFLCVGVDVDAEDRRPLLRRCRAEFLRC
jgi:hypothetical protein